VPYGADRGVGVSYERGTPVLDSSAAGINMCALVARRLIRASMCFFQNPATKITTQFGVTGNVTYFAETFVAKL
jgi:hypothetical protein